MTPSCRLPPRSRVPKAAPEVTPTPRDTLAPASRCRRYGRISSSSPCGACSTTGRHGCVRHREHPLRATPVGTARRATGHPASMSGPAVAARSAPTARRSTARPDQRSDDPNETADLGGRARANRPRRLFTGLFRALAGVFATATLGLVSSYLLATSTWGRSATRCSPCCRSPRSPGARTRGGSPWHPHRPPRPPFDRAAPDVAGGEDPGKGGLQHAARAGSTSRAPARCASTPTLRQPRDPTCRGSPAARRERSRVARMTPCTL